jgi:flagellar basal-body rod modification protein FlgD
MSTIPNVSGYSVNSASSSTLASNTQTAQQLNSEFMTLLMAQLQNQDPTNPVDDSQMIAQQAQMSSLEQMQNLNSNFVAMMAMQNVSQATNLIGHTVTGTDANSSSTTPITGQVTGVAFASGTPVLTVQPASGAAVQMDLGSLTQVN